MIKWFLKFSVVLDVEFRALFMVGKLSITIHIPQFLKTGFHYVFQVDLKLMIFLPTPLHAENIGMCFIWS